MNRLLILGAGAVLTLALRPAASPAHTTTHGVWRDVKCESGLAMLSENDKSWSDLEVDVLARPKRGNRAPSFPSVLTGSAVFDANYKDRVGGEVVARFVVDTLGCVDMRTFTVVSASDSAFTEELLKVIPKYRYEPARKDGTKVRAWLTWKFVFYKDNGARPPFE
jgi:hypothetical protein